MLRQEEHGAQARRRRCRESVQPLYAALDLGTNNCRLLIARRTGDGFRVVDSFSRITRLGAGLAATGRLEEAAMERTLDALSICASKIRQRGVHRLRAVATEACRRAENCESFLSRVEARTGLRLEIISTVEEARLALCGCAPLLDPLVPHSLVFDIGGGSTEISWLERRRGGASRRVTPIAEKGLHDWFSLPIGVVTLAERYGGPDLGPSAYEAMVGEVRAALHDFNARHELAELARGGRLQVLGTSGTVTTLAGVHLNLERYERTRVDGCFLPRPVITEVTRRVCSMSLEQRAAHPCIGTERADLVVAGCAILEGLLGVWPVRRLRVADRGLREGILTLLMADDSRRERETHGTPAFALANAGA